VFVAVVTVVATVAATVVVSATLLLSRVGPGAGLVVNNGGSLGPLGHPFASFLAGELWRHSSLVRGAVIET
jgi:hypothetical protein